MLRFYFDVSDGGRQSHDLHGSLFEAAQSAQVYAIGALYDLADKSAGRGARDIAITVRDESGREISRFGLAIIDKPDNAVGHDGDLVAA